MKDIPEYEGLYAVTEDGRVWSHPRSWFMTSPTNTIEQIRPGRFLKLCARKNGYFYVCLRKGNAKRACTVHRLVALTYIPNPENKPQVNHKDTNKLNNAVSNLEWATRKENAEHAVKNGCYKAVRGEQNGASKLTEASVQEMRRLRKEGADVRDLVERFGVSEKAVYAVLSGTTWGHLPL